MDAAADLPVALDPAESLTAYVRGEFPALGERRSKFGIGALEFFAGARGDAPL